MHSPFEIIPSFAPPQTDLQAVLDGELKEWHFHIYFLQNNAIEHAAAIALRDAVLSLRRDGAFVAVPLWKVNIGPDGPHPVGSYEIWCPSESFSSVFSYLCQNRGSLSVLVHPLSKDEMSNHDARKAWIGQPWPIDLSVLHIQLPEIPLQYASLNMGYSSKTPKPTLLERRRQGAQIEKTLRGEKDAAKAPAT